MYLKAHLQYGLGLLSPFTVKTLSGRNACRPKHSLKYFIKKENLAKDAAFVFIYLFVIFILFFRTDDWEQDVKLTRHFSLYNRESIVSPLTAAWTSLSVNTVWVVTKRPPWFVFCPSQMTSFITSLHLLAHGALTNVPSLFRVRRSIKSYISARWNQHALIVWQPAVMQQEETGGLKLHDLTVWPDVPVTV